MGYTVYSFTSPITVFFYFIILESVLRIVKNNRFKSIQKKYPFNFRLLIYIIMILISMAVHWRILFTRDSRPSTVDVSQLLVLSDDQIYRISDVVDMFRGANSVLEFDIEESQPHLYARFNTCWPVNRNRSWARFCINITHYREESEAIRAMQTISGLRPHAYLSNCTNTVEILLFESAKAFFFPSFDARSMTTDIRIGNVRITLYEVLSFRQFNRSNTNAFIRSLGDTLSE